VVEPEHPLQGSQFHGLAGFPGCPAVDQLGFVEPVDGGWDSHRPPCAAPGDPSVACSHARLPPARPGPSSERSRDRGSVRSSMVVIAGPVRSRSGGGLSGCGWWFSGGGLSAVGPSGLHHPSRPPTHPPAPSRKSPLPPRAGIIGALRDGALRADRIDPDPSRFGVGFRSTSTRRTCSETRVLSRPTPTSPSGSIRRANWGKPR